MSSKWHIVHSSQYLTRVKVCFYVCTCIYMGTQPYAYGVCRTLYNVYLEEWSVKHQERKNEAHPLSQNEMICLYLTLSDFSLQVLPF